MKNDLKNKQKNIFPSEFKQFCRKELSSCLRGLEFLRLFYLFCLFLGVLIISSITLYLLIQDFTSIYIISGQTIMRVTAVLVIGVLMEGEAVRNYKKYAKNIIFKKILSFIGEFKANKNKNLRDKIFNLHLFDEYNKFCMLNRFKGKYKLLDTDIAEIILKHAAKVAGKNQEKTVFAGILITVPNIRKYQNSGYTLVKPNSNTNLNNKLKITPDDTEFAKYFDVYSTDRQETRILLISSFTKKLTQLAKKDLVKNITILFEKGNIYIAISLNKNWFEIPILRAATRIRNYKTLVLELITLIKIIESLKLDKKIGL